MIHLHDIVPTNMTETSSATALRDTLCQGLVEVFYRTSDEHRLPIIIFFDV